MNFDSNLLLTAVSVYGRRVWRHGSSWISLQQSRLSTCQKVTSVGVSACDNQWKPIQGKHASFDEEEKCYERGQG